MTPPVDGMRATSARRTPERRRLGAAARGGIRIAAPGACVAARPTRRAAESAAPLGRLHHIRVEGTMARQQTGNPNPSATQPQQYHQDPSQTSQAAQQSPSQSQQSEQGQQAQQARGPIAGAPNADRERQRSVSREATPGTGMQRGERAGMTTGAGRGATSPSLLPAFMANPDLMASAFMSNPFAFAQAMSQEMDRLFGAPGGETFSPYDRTGGAPGRSLVGGRQQQGPQGLQRWAPPLEVFQRGDELVVRADLPGMRPDDVQIEVEDGVLTISGERREEHEDRERGFYRTERSYGAFSRSIALPEHVDEERVQARYEHGVLEVTVPVPQQQPRRGRRVEIQSGAGASGARGSSAEGGRPNA
ncbi:Hsp20/alpha crystallin family protein [Roseisolibacter agri]|uniref:SHSP domain-containing protein n=1 Tax=Roseisolibacter agri TaxID=2014610 RepID=A0AA37QI21_9BACT|nr:Hsp20/alpha crystallin family protein [Roseisolibacter agri]GLC26880.1 hypothetical protein rosag_33930 [Roseisolibacter agri]